MSSILLFFLGALQITVDATLLRFYQGSFNSYVDINIDNGGDPLGFMSTEFYNSSQDTLFYAHNMKDPLNDITVQIMVDEYINKQNVLLIADTDFKLLPSIPTVTKLKVNQAGQRLGEALKKLFNAGISLAKSLFVGFGLGAHVLAVAANIIKETGLSIPKIIGLDPTRIGFYSDGAILPGTHLDSTSAISVWIYHTNPEGLGTALRVGHVDIRFNCEDRVQPGCAQDGFFIGPNTPPNKCSHARAVFYFVEATKNPNTFIGRSAPSCDAWRIQAGNQTTTIAGSQDISVSGDIYLSTNSNPPYGRGEAGSRGNA